MLFLTTVSLSMQSPWRWRRTCSMSVAERALAVVLLLNGLAVQHCISFVAHGSYECRTLEPTLSTVVPTNATTSTTAPSTTDTSSAGLRSWHGFFANALFETFQSPRSLHWPNHYHPNMECWYNFTAPAGHHVYVEFPVFIVEGNEGRCSSTQDVVTVPTNIGDRLVCGSPRDYGATVTGQRSISVHFRTNEVIEQAGFTGFLWSYETPTKLSLQRGRRQTLEKRRQQAAEKQRKWRWRRSWWFQRFEEQPPTPPQILPWQMLMYSDDDTSQEQEVLSAKQLAVVRKLRYITLNGKLAVQQHGCTDCQIRHYFPECVCQGIPCWDQVGSSSFDTEMSL